jgi:hypothetical protein
MRSVRARFFWTNIAPGFGAAPLTRYVDAAAAVSFSLGTSGSQSATVFSMTGNPFSAYAIAGASRSASFIVPCFSSRVTHPSNAPGTVTGSMPVVGIWAIFREVKYSRVSARGAQPLAFSASSFFVFDE